MTDVKYGPLPDYGDHMTKDEFVASVRYGGFIDYDGVARYATTDQITDVYVSPSDIASKGFDDRFTHVVWFNK